MWCYNLHSSDVNEIIIYKSPNIPLSTQFPTKSTAFQMDQFWLNNWNIWHNSHCLANTNNCPSSSATEASVYWKYSIQNAYIYQRTCCQMYMSFTPGMCILRSLPPNYKPLIDGETCHTHIWHNLSKDGVSEEHLVRWLWKWRKIDFLNMLPSITYYLKWHKYSNII